MEINELNEDLKIDLNDLHGEWLRQSALYMKYAEMAAQSQRMRDQLKEKIDVVRAECDNEIRNDPALFNCPTDKSGAFKPTEAWINSTIQRQEKFQKANEEYHSSNYVMNVLKSAVSAFDHRKKALEMEVQLWQGGYYSVPVDRSEKQGVKAEAVAKASDKQREGLTRRRREAV